MKIVIHPHAKERMRERGATGIEIAQAVKNGESFQAKFGRMGCRRNFPFNGRWQGEKYKTKQVEAYGIKEKGNFIVITVIVKYF